MNSLKGGIQQQKQIKVLCSGDVNGNFKKLLSRVSTVNQKVLDYFRYDLYGSLFSQFFFVFQFQCGPFDILVCVGEFFGPNDEENNKIIDGELQFPMPTYILGLFITIIPCSPIAAVSSIPINFIHENKRANTLFFQVHVVHQLRHITQRRAENFPHR